MVQLYSSKELLLRKYKFNFQNLPENLKCTICHEVLKNAYQSSCGCKFCEKCLTNYLNGESKQCPSKLIDCEKIILNSKNIYNDNATNKEISKLICTCPFKQCEFSDRLFTMSQHIDKCQFQEISCTDCNKLLMKKYFHDHQINDCEMRIIKCEMCAKDFNYKFLKEIHWNPNNDDICHNYYDKCPNSCEINGNVNIKEHLKVCSNIKYRCPFYIFNCTKERITRTHLLKHNTEENLSHMQMLIDRILHLENSLVDLKDQLAVSNKIIADQNNIIKTTNITILEIQKSNEHLKSQKLSTINNINKEPDVVCINSCFIWKIENFRILKREAENRLKLFVTSIPFYINQFGYRLCLKIYPNGDGIGKETHLSVFFTIMKGKYDDLLVWPFQQKIILSLLEQNGGTNHHTEILKPDSKSICYRKPIEEYNIGSGSPKFISQSELVRENSVYCKNDAIFIKIMLD